MESQTKSYFDRDTTLVIKGVAIIFMFIHHMLTMPENLLPEYSFSEGYWSVATLFCNPFKMCVAIFAFLNGYFYFYNRNKNYKYSLNKSLSLLISYWAIFIPAVIVALITKAQGSGLVRGIVGIDNSYILFSWYIEYFLILMIVFPLVARLMDKSIFYSLALIIVPNIIICSAFESLGGPVLANLYLHFARWFGVTVVGYLFAKYEVFDKGFDNILNKVFEAKILRTFIVIVFMVFAMMMRVFSEIVSVSLGSSGLVLAVYAELDILCAPVVVYGIVTLSKIINVKWLTKVLMELGKYSMYMWLIHSIFFGCNKELFQPLIYFAHFPLVTLILGLAICYGLGKLIDTLIKPVIKLTQR